MRKQQRGLQFLGAAFLGVVISLVGGLGLGNIDSFFGLPSFARQPVVHSVNQVMQQPVPGDSRMIAEQVQQGRVLYQNGQFVAAIAVWQQLAQTYAMQNNNLAQASILSNLALAYQQLGQWENARTVIADSFARLPDDLTTFAPASTDLAAIEQWSVKAQVLMAQGSLQIALGQAEQALESWQQADEAYDNSGDDNGRNRAQINQAQALRELGFYHQAQEKLNSVLKAIENQPQSLLKATLLRRLGESLRLTGALTEAQHTLNQSLAVAENYDSPEEMSATLLSLGHVAQGMGHSRAAEYFYQQANQAIPQAAPTQLIPIQLAQLALWIETANWPAAADLWPVIQAQLNDLPPSRSAVYHQVSWGHSLIKFNQALKVSNGKVDGEIDGEMGKKAETATAPVPWLTIAQQLQRAAGQASALEDTRAESHAVGTLAQVYEQTQQWAIAQTQTQRALNLTQGKTDIAYQWQWQLGRIWQAAGNPEQSIQKSLDAYYQAIDSLSVLRGDLAVGSDNAQFSFKEDVEPIYRQLVSLLLQTDQQSPDYQKNLASAQDVIESLHLAELDNYFKEACLDIQPIDITQVDQKAAVAYSIVLEDRLSVILRLPNQPLQQFSTVISASDVTNVTNQLRQQLVIRSRREYFTLAQQVYQWLIDPAREAIDQSDVETIVFVLDGPLQNVPMAALYDGDHFLIEDYSVALTPGLKLLNPQPWNTDNLSALVAGLTESRLGLAPLPHVAQEVEKITENISNNTVLLNQTFTSQTLPKTIKSVLYPIVHIATHGQFGSTPEETYLVAWDEPIKVREVSQILQANLGDRAAIELLVLSACETASGDQRAALGLSGVAVKAGARSTLGTLWSINDEATARFIGHFYEQLTQPGATRASALRSAQLQLLKDPQYRHPIYWAPYILLGSWL